MDIIKSFLNFMKIKQRENNRDLDFFESDLFYFLKLLYVKGTLNKAVIRKKRRLTEDEFKIYEEFSREKGYIKSGINSNETTYSITTSGTDYLLEFRKTRQAKSNANWMAGATVVVSYKEI